MYPKWGWRFIVQSKDCLWNSQSDVAWACSEGGGREENTRSPVPSLHTSCCSLGGLQYLCRRHIKDSTSGLFDARAKDDAGKIPGVFHITVASPARHSVISRPVSPPSVTCQCAAAYVSPKTLKKERWWFCCRRMTETKGDGWRVTSGDHKIRWRGRVRS